MNFKKYLIIGLLLSVSANVTAMYSRLKRMFTNPCAKTKLDRREMEAQTKKDLSYLARACMLYRYPPKGRLEELSLLSDAARKEGISRDLIDLINVEGIGRIIASIDKIDNLFGRDRWSCTDTKQIEERKQAINTILQSAAKDGIKASYILNAIPTNRGPLLFTVVQWSCPEILEYLVQRGLNPRYIDTFAKETEQTALHFLASQYNFHDLEFEFAELLLKYKVPVDLKDISGSTPLVAAVKDLNRFRSKSRFIQLFLEYGANPNIKNKDGNTALMIFLRYWDQTPAYYIQNWENIIGFFLQSGTDIGLKNYAHKTIFEIIPLNHVGALVNIINDYNKGTQTPPIIMNGEPFPKNFILHGTQPDTILRGLNEIDAFKQQQVMQEWDVLPPVLKNIIGEYIYLDPESKKREEKRVADDNDTHLHYAREKGMQDAHMRTQKEAKSGGDQAVALDADDEQLLRPREQMPQEQAETQRKQRRQYMRNRNADAVTESDIMRKRR